MYQTSGHSPAQPCKQTGTASKADVRSCKHFLRGKGAAEVAWGEVAKLSLKSWLLHSKQKWEERGAAAALKILHG